MSLNDWSAAEIAEKLSGSGRAKSKKTRQGWMVCCPAHADRTPSLSLADAGKGMLLYHCFGGCQPDDVRSALMDVLGIQPGQSHDAPKPKKKKVVVVKEEQIEAIVPVPDDKTGVSIDDFHHFEHGSPSLVWTYRLPEGRIAGWVARYDFEDGSKEVIPWAWTKKENGTQEKLRMKAMPAPRPLYNEDQIAERSEDPILWNEGEKAADAAQKLFPGWVSTACQGGGNAVTLARLKSLYGRKVIFLCDHDGPGYLAASKIIDSLIGKASLYFLKWPTKRLDGSEYKIEEKDDAADHLARGWTADELREISRLYGGLTIKISEIAPSFDVIQYDRKSERRFQDIGMP